MSIKSIWLFCFSVLPGECDGDAVVVLTRCYMWPCWRSGKTHTTDDKENLFFICCPWTQAELSLSIFLSQNRFFVYHVQFWDSAKHIAIAAAHISPGLDYVLYILRYHMLVDIVPLLPDTISRYPMVQLVWKFFNSASHEFGRIHC